jgi:hypothetical protein
VTRYRTLVSTELLHEMPTSGKWAEGLRLVEISSPNIADGDLQRTVVFEDENAPAEMEGRLVEPVLQRRGDGRVVVLSRTVVSER